MLYWWMEEVTVHSWCKHTYSLFLLPLRLWHIKYVRWQRECVDVLQWTHWASIITPINLEPDPQTQCGEHACVLAFIVPLSFRVELRCLIQPQNIRKILYNISLNIWGRSLCCWLLQYTICIHLLAPKASNRNFGRAFVAQKPLEHCCPITLFILKGIK